MYEGEEKKGGIRKEGGKKEGKRGKGGNHKPNANPSITE